MSLKHLRRIAAALVAGVFLAQAAPAHPAAAQGAPPHAWLFGMWAGGVLPAPDKMSARECQEHATFVVTQDAVIHSTLTHPTAIQNLIASVRGTPNGTIFLLAPTDTKADDIGGVSDDLGFGCPQDNVLRIVRVGPNQIAFPDCTGFPNTLVRCPQPG